MKFCRQNISLSVFNPFLFLCSGREDLLLLQSVEAGPKVADISRRVASASSSAGGLGVGLLDVAEAAVQALLAPNACCVTFTICADPSRQLRQTDVDQRPLVQSAAMEAVYGPPPPKIIQGTDRASRENYYAILDMADADMKTSYLLRGASAYKAQILEDAAVESYWAVKFGQLARDQSQ
jgi:hypothetical protein